MSKWNPIASAPRDGSPIELRVANYRGGSLMGEGRFEGGEWLEANGLPFLAPPTHWRNLRHVVANRTSGFASEKSR